MTAFDPSSATAGGGFDPSSAAPAATGFDPSTAKPWKAPAAVRAVTAPAAKAAKSVVKNVEKADVGLAQRWDAIKRNPLTAAMDTLGTLQRGVGGAAYAVEHHQDVHQALSEIGKDVFMTKEGTFGGHGISDSQAQAIRDRTTESVRVGVSGAMKAASGGVLGLPSHQDIDKMIAGQKWIPKEAKPYVSGIMKGGEDIGLQTGSDPMTPLGGVVFRGIGGLLKVARTFEDAHNVAKAVGLGQQFQHLEPIYKGSHAIAQRVADHPAVSFFRARPELENFSLGATHVPGAKVTGATGGFTSEGKKIRMQIENKVSTQANTDRFIDEALDSPAARENRLKDYIAQYGDATKRAQLAALGHNVPAGAANAYLSKASGLGADVGKFLTKFRGMTAEEQIDALRMIRNDARDGSLAKKTESAVRLWNTAGTKTDQILKPGSVIADYRAVPHESQAVAAIKRAGDEIAPVHAIRDIMRTSIFLNPLPHGIKNVGELTYMAGGLPAVFRGFKAMATGAIDHTRLQQMGALPEYTQHQLEQSFWAKTPIFGPAWMKVAGPMQAAMERMEQGWRQGLLETLDKKLGTSGGLKEELLKGHMLQEHLGDYANQSALVHSFAALGGPFAAFRVGIVPKAVLRTIQNNPDRILLALRAKYGLSNQPDSHGAKMEVGGPGDDFMRLATDPLGFFLSPSTLGAIGGASQQAQYGKNDTPGQLVARTLEQYNPVGEVGALLNAITNGARPGGHENLADRLVDVIMLSFGAYFKREQQMKTVNASNKKTASQANKAYKPIMNALDSLGGSDGGPAVPSSGGAFDPGTASASAGGGFDPSSAR